MKCVFQRIAVVEKYRPVYESQAQQNLKEGGRKGGLANSSKPLQNSSMASNVKKEIDVRAKLAETAGVSTDTYSKGEKILDSDNEILKQGVLSGDNRAQNLAVHYLPIISCTCVYLACKSVYECGCGILG